MFFAAFVLGYLGLFNSAELEMANPLYSGILFGVSEGVGMFCGERFLELVADATSLKLLFPAVAVSSTLLKMPGLGVNELYLALFI